VEPRGFTPLLSFALQNAEKLDSEIMISPGSNPLRTHFVIVAKSRPVLLPPKALLQVVNLDQSYPCCVVLAAHNGGVVIGRERGNDGRFQIVRRGNCRGADVGFL
jgi:hypothetical protein